MDLDVLPFVTLHNGMPSVWVERLRKALFNVEQEIHDSGNGLKTDGRRSVSLRTRGSVPLCCCLMVLCASLVSQLVAYRRLLDLLQWIRLCNREIRGEDNDNLSIVRVDKELTALEGVIRRDMPGLNASYSEV